MLVSTVFSAVGVAIPATASATLVSRIESVTPYRTAVQAVMSDLPPNHRKVVIANGTAAGCVDGQLGNSLAGALACPIFFTDRDRLDPFAASAIQSLGATEALIVGGTSMVGPSVETSLAAMGLVVNRYGGANLYEDARAVALETASRGAALWPFLRRVRIAPADPSPDWRAMYALGGTAYRGIPTLFTEYSTVPSITLDTLEAIDAECVCVLGSDAYVSDDVIDTLRGAGYTVDRVVETGRNGLGEAIGDYAVENG